MIANWGRWDTSTDNTTWDGMYNRRYSDDTSSGTQFNQYGVTSTYFDDKELERLWERIQQLENSRAWIQAKKVIKPIKQIILNYNYIRRISPSPWTGKNYKKL